jgi:predicted ferric reductase
VLVHVALSAEWEMVLKFGSEATPWRVRFGAISTAALLALVASSLWRLRLRLSYEWWQLLHAVLAVVVIVAALVHVILVDYYINSPWKQALWVVMSAAFVTLLGWVRLGKPLTLRRRPWTIERVTPERGETTTLTLRPIGHPGFRFRPGQYAWIVVDRSPFSLTQHPFSFSSSAEAVDGRVEMTIRNLGDFTSAVDKVPAGQRVYIDGPYGAFTIGNPADMHVLIAGGVGITPMTSMIRTFADRGDPRPVILLYGSKDWESITFREELETLKARLNLTVVHVLADPPPGWTGERGFITAEVFKRHLPPPYADHEYFICGPNVMMDAIEAALGQMKVPMSKYHSERYSFV